MLNDCLGSKKRSSHFQIWPTKFSSSIAFHCIFQTRFQHCVILFDNQTVFIKTVIVSWCWTPCCGTWFPHCLPLDDVLPFPHGGMEVNLSARRPKDCHHIRFAGLSLVKAGTAVARPTHPMDLEANVKCPQERFRIPFQRRLQRIQDDLND